MAVNSKGAWIGIGVGDVDDPNAPRQAPNWHAIELMSHKLHDKFQWVRKTGFTPGPAFTAETAALVKQVCINYGMPVTLDINSSPVANLAFRTRLGSFPPPPPPRHAMLTVRGTGGVVGMDYTSVIAQNSFCHYEVPILYAASMGGIPVAAATDPNAPSGNECAHQCYEMIAQWLRSSGNQSFSMSAYSLGTKGVDMVLDDMRPGGPLAQFASRFVCAVLIGNPWRRLGHTFYLGPIPEGQGIGSPVWTVPERVYSDYRVCELAHPDDMYTNSPLGGSGQVLCDVEEVILGTAVSDPLGTIGRALPLLLKIVADSGISLPGMAMGMLTGATTGNVAGIGLLLLPMLIGMLPTLISTVGGHVQNLPPGPAADVQAAIIALKFYGSGIAGHVHYHDTPWSANSDQSYLELGIQHANDWGSRTLVTT